MGFKIKINDFLGRNLKADPLDINTHEAQTLDGFEVNTKPGSLIKRKGYTDQASVILPANYPSNWTIKNFFQFRVTKPSIKQIMVVHATVGGEDRIYVDYVYTGGTWVQGWVELTENEESWNADAGTNTTTVVYSGLLSSVNDYYNGWYLFNWTRRKGAIISDYVGATNTITLSPAIAGQTTGDVCCVYRYPLVVNIDGGSSGYTADTGSSTTQVYDIDNPTSDFYEITQDFDDAYNGWIVWNTGTDGNDSTLANVSDYQSLYAGNVQRVVHGVVANQTDGDFYYLYKLLRVLSVDDKVQFRQRPNICIMNTGSTARYPKQYPLWYGFLRETYYFGVVGNLINDGFYFEPSTLDAPDDEIFSTSLDNTGSIGITDNVYIACAYVYDGFQVGPMTSISRSFSQVQTSTDGSDDIRITFSIGYSAAPNMRHSRALNKRVTGVLVYAATDLDTDSKTATWHKIKQIPIREDYNIAAHKSKSSSNEDSPVSSDNNRSRRARLTPSGRSNRAELIKASLGWTGSDPYAQTYDIDSDAWSAKSDFYTLDSGGMGGERVNYLQAADSVYNSVAVNLFLDKQETSLMIASPLKDNGTPSPDYFPLLNILDLANYGVMQAYDIKIVNDYVYIGGDIKSLRFLMSQGLVPAFKLDTEYEGLGTANQNGFVKFKNKVFGVFKNGIYLLGGNEELLSYPIEDTTNYPIGVTTLSEGYAAYSPNRKEFLVAFPTDSKIFTYDVIRKQWASHSIGAAINSLVVGVDNEMYGSSGTKIFRLDNGTTDDSTSINPQWKSKVYSMGSMEATLKEVEVTYRSNTVLDFDVYLNRGSAASWAVSTDNQLAAATTTTTVKLNFPNGFRASQFEFGITIPSGSRATNTYAEVYQIEITGIEEERVV